MLPIRKNQNWLPDIFNDFFNNNWMEKTNATAPAINVLEHENGYSVEVAAPGMTKDDFQIHVDDNDNLIISMEKKTDNQKERANGRYLRVEDVTRVSGITHNTIKDWGPIAYVS